MKVYGFLSFARKVAILSKKSSDLVKQRELDADPRAIQKIEFYETLKTNSQVCTVLEKSKETILEFYKGTTKVLSEYINGWIQQNKR